MAHRTELEFRDLQFKIAEANNRRNEYEYVLRQTQLEDAAAQMAGKPFDINVSIMYHNAIIKNDTCIGELKRQLPCKAFIDRFGLWLHEEYRESYPINADTQLEERQFIGNGVRYDIINIHAIILGPSDEIPATIIPMDSREAMWERWRGPQDTDRIVALAYNEVDNVVYIGV